MTKEELIAKLNQDLADELGAMIQYILYAARATGPYRPQLSQFFLAEVADEQMHAQFLANKIVSLGGKPTTVPRAVAAYFGGSGTPISAEVEHRFRRKWNTDFGKWNTDFGMWNIHSGGSGTPVPES